MGVIAASILTVGATGIIDFRGGDGAPSAGGDGAGGGGGGGGALTIISAAYTNDGTVTVAGGIGGAGSGTGTDGEDGLAGLLIVLGA